MTCSAGPISDGIILYQLCEKCRMLGSPAASRMPVPLPMAPRKSAMMVSMPHQYSSICFSSSCHHCRDASRTGALGVRNCRASVQRWGLGNEARTWTWSDECASDAQTATPKPKTCPRLPVFPKMTTLARDAWAGTDAHATKGCCSGDVHIQDLQPHVAQSSRSAVARLQLSCGADAVLCGSMKTHQLNTSHYMREAHSSRCSSCSVALAQNCAQKSSHHQSVSGTFPQP